MKETKAQGEIVNIPQIAGDGVKAKAQLEDGSIINVSKIGKEKNWYAFV